MWQPWGLCRWAFSSRLSTARLKSAESAGNWAASADGSTIRVKANALPKASEKAAAHWRSSRPGRTDSRRSRCRCPEPAGAAAHHRPRLEGLCGSPGDCAAGHLAADCPRLGLKAPNQPEIGPPLPMVPPSGSKQTRCPRLRKRRQRTGAAAVPVARIPGAGDGHCIPACWSDSGPQ